jgi:D-beta-D-heptose 7-phosphate kinase/D-beta-D-heptose 1-phosphate adenosyltransferase
VIHQPVEEVFDVGGAGDTVIAVIALALLAGHELSSAASIANVAAGVVVRKQGVAMCEATDLLVRLAPETDGSPEDGSLGDRIDCWRSAGDRIVFTNGCFDVLHPGHLHLLAEAASLGDRLIVGLNSDRSVRALKGDDRPCLASPIRAGMLQALSFVDAVEVYDEATPLALIERIAPDALVKGGDYDVAEVVGRDSVEAQGGRVVIVPLMPGWSTTGALDRFVADGVEP